MKLTHKRKMGDFVFFSHSLVILAFKLGVSLVPLRLWTQFSFTF